MTYDWEAARPTDLWNFLFMFRFNKKKDLSCVAFLHSSVRKCSRKLWKISAKCTGSCPQTEQKAEVHYSSGGKCHFLVFFQLSEPRLFPFPPWGRRGKCRHILHLFQSLNPLTRHWGEEAYRHLSWTASVISKVVILAERRMVYSILRITKQFGVLQMLWIWCLVVIPWIKTQEN